MGSFHAHDLEHLGAVRSRRGQSGPMRAARGRMVKNGGSWTCWRPGFSGAKTKTHDKRRLHHSHDDTLMLDLFCQSLGPGLKSAFGARIGCQEGTGDTTRHRANVDDERLGLAPAGSGNHSGEDSTSELECTESVLSSGKRGFVTHHLDNSLQLFRSSIGKRDRHFVRRAGIID
jgi:hypothetical protein